MIKRLDLAVAGAMILVALLVLSYSIDTNVPGDEYYESEGLGWNYVVLGDDSASIKSVKVLDSSVVDLRIPTKVIDPLGNAHEVKVIGSFFKAYANDNVSEIKSIKSIHVPNSVEKIEDYAFSGLFDLRIVEFEKDSKLTSIGYQAFHNSGPKFVYEINGGNDRVEEPDIFTTDAINDSSVDPTDMPVGTKSIVFRLSDATNLEKPPKFSGKYKIDK
uniref:leucine-rich repeat protein n=1 Tax=Candidatus Methanarcanum hacksteinii TaxID=2911857 RepID=UPI0037DC3CFB